ncbi:Tripeptidyl aminopeptidase [Cyphellophora attinorum]|uniref:Tripeptidyl aminopeptidase n=1 Tax=Cyphellophora attinorum TaxID=1664694 RepID=A0A0N0NHK1_9EURO|nr:Tripeptidyl aminopeptidase [Phialophora attinorum]KPI34658.1 Tripeptidyl aminopeptidase [Phialophora attinorum]
MKRWALLLAGLSVTVAGLPQTHEVLNWAPCQEVNKQIADLVAPFPITPFDCANLMVPLDYDEPCTSEKIQLDLFRVNATQKPVLGSVLFNPGGPGGTAAEMLPLVAESGLHLNIGGQFNLISWDPRGTGNTIPFNCSTGESAATGNPVRRGDYRTLPSSNVTQNFIDVGWDIARQKAEDCYATNNGTGEFIGTGSVAHDMISIIDSLGEDGLLRYYGWSYGSALGFYFAAMFPERVDRMLLDGNVNPHTWQLGYRPELFEAVDKAFAAFIDECWKNGKDCALVTELNTTSKAEIWNTMDALIYAAAKNTTTAAGFEAYIAILGLIEQRLYYPKQWPKLAQIFADMLTGKIEASPANSSAPAPQPYNHGVDAIDGIRCSDATFQTAELEEYFPILAQQLNHSRGFGAFYNAVWPCASWKMPDKQQYRGDFKVKTRHPILMVNGEFDPTTPISGAYNASSAFDGSVVLAHNGYGHGIFPSPSKCVAEKIQQYFVHGSLPEAGIACEPDFGPWELAEYYAANNISRPF